MEYAFAIILVFIGIRFNSRMAKSLRITYLATICLYVILLMGFRYRVGIDTLNYMDGYLSVTTTLDDFWNLDFTQTRYEPGYLFLAACCRSISNDFFILQLACAFILNSCVFIFLYRYCYNPFVGVIVYFVLTCLYFNTEIMRESLAIAIFLLNYSNLKSRKWVRYYFLCLFSICFHYSAVILIFFPFAKWIKFNVWFVAMCVMLLLVSPLMETLNTYLTIASIEKRMVANMALAEVVNLNYRLANFYNVAALPIGMMFLYRWVNKQSQFAPYILFRTIIAFGVFSIPIVFSRFTNYTTMFLVVYCANFLEMKCINVRTKYLSVILLIVSQLYYYSYMYPSWIPYSSIFSKEINEKREELWFEHNN